MPARRAVSTIRRAVSTLVAMGFCTWMCFFVCGADLQGLQAEIREGADVHEIHSGVAAHLLVSADELRAVPLGEPAAGFLVDVRANGQAEADVPVGLGVLPGDRSRSDHSDVHDGLF